MQTRESLINKLSANLPILRAKMKISQSDLADLAGIGRQTLISIESGSGKMRWDTFLSILLIMSKDPDVNELLVLFGLSFEEVSRMIEKDILGRKVNASSIQEKLWTDCNYDGDVTIRGIVPLPIGLKAVRCPKCQSAHVSGVIIMSSADEQDPNILCLDCGYWWD